jgi:Outer membrane protein beta-barrel domain
MRFDYMIPVRQAAIPMVALAGLLATAAPVCAQGLGLGARIAWVNPDVEADVNSVRFFGGQMRLLGPRLGIEFALDRHSESFELLNQKVTETPIQTSLLLRMGGGKVSPFLLGGPGWYRRKVEALDSPGDLNVSTTEFGWHAGVGLEILPSRHFGIHGDYRYTFLDFHDDDDEGFIGGLFPGHRGSMWTLGATFYF